jgi:hypothetical protein
VRAVGERKHIETEHQHQKYLKNKQKELISLQNAKIQLSDFRRRKTLQADIKRESIRSAGNAMLLNTLQEADEKARLIDRPQSTIKEFSSSIVVHPQALIDRLKAVKR